MVEPVSLTLGAVTAALVAKASDKAAERAVDDAAGCLARLVGWLRQRFVDANDAGATAALTKVEEVPDSRSRIGELAAVIDRSAEDAGFCRALELLVEEARAGGFEVGSIAQTAWGHQNVQAAVVADSTLTVTYGQSPFWPR